MALGPRLPCFPPLTLQVCSHPGQAVFQCWTKSQGDECSIGDQRQVSACCDTGRGTVCYHLWPFHCQSECSHLMWAVSKIKTTAGSVPCQDFLWKNGTAKEKQGQCDQLKCFPQLIPLNFLSTSNLFPFTTRMIIFIFSFAFVVSAFLFMVPF